jgi:hypothetical protein
MPLATPARWQNTASLGIGDKIGNLLVTDYVGTRIKKGRSKGAKWRVRCACGRTDTLMTSEVRNNLACRVCIGVRCQTTA